MVDENCTVVDVAASSNETIDSATLNVVIERERERGKGLSKEPVNMLYIYIYYTDAAICDVVVAVSVMAF